MTNVDPWAHAFFGANNAHVDIANGNGNTFNGNVGVDAGQHIQTGGLPSGPSFGSLQFGDNNAHVDIANGNGNTFNGSVGVDAGQHIQTGGLGHPLQTATANCPPPPSHGPDLHFGDNNAHVDIADGNGNTFNGSVFVDAGQHIMTGGSGYPSGGDLSFGNNNAYVDIAGGDHNTFNGSVMVDAGQHIFS